MKTKKKIEEVNRQKTALVKYTTYMYENPVIVLNNSTQVFVCSTLIYSKNMRIFPPKEIYDPSNEMRNQPAQLYNSFFSCISWIVNILLVHLNIHTYKYQPIDKYVNLCVYVLNVPKDIIDFESGKSFMCS